MKNKYFGVRNWWCGKDIYEVCIKLAKNSDCEKRKFGCVIALEEYGTMAPGEPDIVSVWGEGYNKKVCSGLDCCKAREKIASGMRTEYCEAIRAQRNCYMRESRE